MQGTRQKQELEKEHGPLRLYLSSLHSDYTREAYRFYINKFLKTTGYKDIDHFLATAKKEPKSIEDQLIEFIISLKETGSKFSTIVNYVKPILGFLKISDVLINYNKVNRFVPPYVRSKKTRGYSVEEISSLMQVADERMRAVILILSSGGLRINGLCGLSIGSLKEVGDLYQITVYENEPEEYITFVSSECKKTGIDPYLQMRERYNEVLSPKSPLIREQFDRRDPFAAAHPKFVSATVLTKKLVHMAEAVGIRNRAQLAKGQKAASVLQTIPICNGMRRYYCKALLDSGLVTEKRWLLEGHNLKGNDTSYLKISAGDLFQSYMLAHDKLVISQEHKLRERVQKLEVERNEIQALALELEKIKKATGIE
jgi:site-specific recombinase XerD